MHLAATHTPLNVATETVAQPPLPSSGPVSWISLLSTTHWVARGCNFASHSLKLSSVTVNLLCVSLSLPSISLHLSSAFWTLIDSS